MSIKKCGSTNKKIKKVEWFGGIQFIDVWIRAEQGRGQLRYIIIAQVAKITESCFLTKLNSKPKREKTYMIETDSGSESQLIIVSLASVVRRLAVVIPEPDLNAQQIRFDGGGRGRGILTRKEGIPQMRHSFS